MPVMGEVDWRTLLSGVGNGRPLTIGDSLMLYTWISQLEDLAKAAATWVEASNDNDDDVTEEARYALEEAVVMLEPGEAKP